VKIRAKYPKLQAKCEEIWAKYVQTFAKLLYVRLFYKNGTQNESKDVFLEVICIGFFSGKFAEICAKIIRNPKTFPVPTPMRR